MNAEQSSEIWQIESAGRIIDADFEEITDMIGRGDLLRMDRVRQGEMRWIEAGKVQSLMSVFNAKDGDRPAKPVITLTKLGVQSASPSSNANGNALLGTQFTTEPPSFIGVPICSMHADVAAVYICGTCFSHFCKTCPATYGGPVKICPYCGAACETIAKSDRAENQPSRLSRESGGSGLGGFVRNLLNRITSKAN